MDNSELRRTAREAFRQMDEGQRHLTIEQIAAYAKSEMSESEYSAAARHLMECADCRERHDEFAAFAADSEAAPDSDLEEEWQALQRRIHPKKVVMMPRWIAIAASVVAVVGLSYAGYRILAPSPARLLAEAYAEQRSFEFRIADARYAPIRQQRGGGSAFSMPAPLLKAQSKLAEELKTAPDDPQLLRLKGEAEMIGRDAAAAVQTLLRANDLAPKNAAILADLGSAYALLGEIERRPGDYILAIDYLGRSIRLAANPEAMFNCALALEKAQLYDRALEQWDRYLKSDPSGEWSAEARKHRDELAPKVKAKEKALLLDPSPEAFLAQPDSADAEAYLREAAVTEWLPKVHAGGAPRSAAERLAQLLAGRHKDRWLADSLASGASADWAKLAEVRARNMRGDAEGALTAAREAAGTLARSGTAAGVLWARMEEVVGLRDLLRNKECLGAARSLARDLEQQPYLWLRAETYVEAQTCSVRLGEIDESAAYLRLAMRASQEADYGEIQLRVRNLALPQELGAPSEVYAQAAESLRIFWSGRYPIYRYYQTADMLRFVASAAGQSDAALFFARSVTWSATFQPDVSYQASAHEYLAAAALGAGEIDEADEHRKQGDALIVRVGAEKRFGYYLGPQTALASAMMQRGDTEGALRLLEDLGKSLQPSGYSRGDIRYYSLFGEALRRKGLLEKAAQELERGIAAGRVEIESVHARPERASLIQPIADSYRGLVSAKLAQPDESDALRIWRSYRALDARPGVRPEAVRGTALILAQLPDGFAGWLVQQERVVFHRLSCSLVEARTVVPRFLRMLSDPGSSRPALERDARQLYRWVIEPFEKDLKERFLAVELDGILSGLPVQALIMPDGQYFCDRFRVVLSPGYEIPAPAPIDARSRLFAMVNPAVLGESSARFPPLTDSEAEGAAARAAFPSSELIEGRAATVEALGEQLRTADIVLFAGHGYSSGGSAALIFAPKTNSGADYELVRAERLARQDWTRCRLAVLSSCAAAEGESRGAHNPESLVRALLHAGASRVAASLWPIDSAATSQLMSSFYGGLAKGKAPGEALDEARRQVRQHAAWGHPYYWAGFQLYGAS